MKYKTSPEHEFLKLLDDLEYNWKTRTLNLLSLHRVIQKSFMKWEPPPLHFKIAFRKDKIVFSSFTILILIWMTDWSTVFYNLRGSESRVVTRKPHIVSVCHHSPSHNEALHLAAPGDHGLPDRLPEGVRPGVHWRLLRLLRLRWRFRAKLLKISAVWTQKGDFSCFCRQLICFVQMWRSGRKEADLQLSSRSVPGS